MADYNDFLCTVRGPNIGYETVFDALRYCSDGLPPSETPLCFAYYVSCSPYAPPDTCAVGGGIELTPATVDSVMSAFSLGFQGGILTFLPVVGFAVAILVVVALISYAVSKS